MKIKTRYPFKAHSKRRRKPWKSISISLVYTLNITRKRIYRILRDSGHLLRHKGSLMRLEQSASIQNLPSGRPDELDLQILFINKV